MRLGVLSDLHLDNYPHPEELLSAVLLSAKNGGADAFLLAGDVAGRYDKTLEILRQIDGAFPRGCLFVPGNHDIWNKEHEGLSSWDIYNRLLAFPRNLARGPRDIGNGWVAVGDIGWYDYSFGSPSYSTSDFDRMEHGGRVWQDRHFARWGMSPSAVHRHFLCKLERQLERVREGAKVLLVTHVVPVAEFTVPFRPQLWGYLNAFMGGASYGRLALRYGVQVAVSGHVHFRRQVVHGSTRFVCNCLGYRYQWRSGRNSYLEVDRAMTFLDLE